MTMDHFAENLKKYATLIIDGGVQIKPEQTLVIEINVDQQELAHLLVKIAYERGAREVIVKWKDDVVQSEFLQFAADECLQEIPHSTEAEVQEWLAKSVSRIAVVSGDPDALAAADPERVALYQSALGKARRPLMQATQANQVSWTVVAAAGKEWAAKVFPDLPSSEEQVDALWDAIFKTTRVYADDPLQAWQHHDQNMQAQAEKLNKEQFTELHYWGPGTDLRIGLAHNHLWEGAGSFNAKGEKFIANMPTEEVFTAPDCRRAEGTVVSTKPLSYAGTIIKGMKFTFKAGEIIEASAEQGQEVLLKLLETDPGAKRLGEAALVPDPSPISRSGLTFYNTLFDENASCHLAVGAAYPFNLKGGTTMSEEELAAAGLNRSQTHVDFMIGSADLNIDGIRADGSTVPVFRNGDWAE